ncbi:odorant receptor 49a-like [Musca vetustissima]|uniref:odorant receptor 49a-like n=1 Tax=Musca vetustissima TaxID=27455 RepID=UPI002AB6EC54|nr:odorant receptor 49a-like [Musca vetustissima]
MLEEEDERYFEDLVNLPYGLLKTLGYDFPAKYRPLWMRGLMIIYFILCLIFCSMFTYFTFDLAISEIAEGAHDLPLLLRLIDHIIYNVVGILKSYFFLRNIKSMTDIYKRFRDIYPTTLEDRRAYRVNDYHWPKWITTILYWQLVTLLIILFLPMGEAFIEYFGALIKVGYENAEFGYYRMYAETTYGISHYNPLGYIIVYIFDMMNSHYSTVWMIVPDIWVVGFCLQLCQHFDYISRTLENYKPQQENEQKDLRVLAGLVKKHQIVLE